MTTKAHSKAAEHVSAAFKAVSEAHAALPSAHQAKLALDGAYGCLMDAERLIDPTVPDWRAKRSMSRARAIAAEIAAQERSARCVNDKLASYKVHRTCYSGQHTHCGRRMWESLRGSDDWSKVTCKSCLRGKPA